MYWQVKWELLNLPAELSASLHKLLTSLPRRMKRGSNLWDTEVVRMLAQPGPLTSMALEDREGWLLSPSPKAMVSHVGLEGLGDISAAN